MGDAFSQDTSISAKVGWAMPTDEDIQIGGQCPPYLSCIKSLAELIMRMRGIFFDNKITIWCKPARNIEMLIKNGYLRRLFMCFGSLVCHSSAGRNPFLSTISGSPPSWNVIKLRLNAFQGLCPGLRQYLQKESLRKYKSKSIEF